jgi:tetratricopeptide (TPR) repeat protein
MLIIALGKKNMQERAKDLNELIRFKPSYARTYNALGNAYYNLRDYEGAIESYKKSLEISASYEHPYYGLGSIYNQMGNHD